MGCNFMVVLREKEDLSLIRKNERILTKNAEVRKEFLKLKKIYRFLPKDTFKVNENLIKNAAFMAVSLQELQALIDDNGYTEEYKNGQNQKGIKKSSEVDIYNTYIKNYTTIIKMLNELLPKSAASSDDAENLLKFAARGR